MDDKAGERNVLSFLKASDDGASIAAARDAADPIMRKANIDVLIPKIAEELSKMKKGKPDVIKNLIENGKFSEVFKNNDYILLDSLDTTVDPKSNSTERKDVINKIKNLYNILYVGPGKLHKNKLGGRKTKKHRKTRKHRRNKTRRN
jgi:hypothetical protein